MCNLRLLSRLKHIRVYHRLAYIFNSQSDYSFVILVYITLDISFVTMQDKIHDTLTYACGFLFICRDKKTLFIRYNL
jgi:hypothetical protein